MRPGTHPVLAGGRSARPSICARSSSRKRTQSARRSSVTNSPGGSDSPAGALSGCCSGPEITPHFLWKLWITLVSVNRQRCAPRFSCGRLSRRDSKRSRQARQPPKRSGRPRPTGGQGRTQSPRKFIASRGAALGRCGWPNAGGLVGRADRSPGLYSLFAGDREG